jgi:hypothetical protein
MTSRHASILCLSLAAIAGGAASAGAASATECTASQTCYCVNQDVKEAILKRVAEIRLRIADQKTQGKAIGYLSIPISSFAGGYEGLNAKVAENAKKQLEERFGARAAWMLNTAAADVKLPEKARGAEYMLMWTKVLEGEDGLGRDFDFIYFVGLSDYAQFLKLDGKGDMEKLEAYYEENAKTDPDLAKIDKTSFRNYYGLRASVTASRGSHDEWNIIRMINEKRRHDSHKSEFGISRQVAVLFDGRGLPPGPTESATASGYVGGCP